MDWANPEDEGTKKTKRQEYDSLPDFHLRNPLKSIDDDVSNYKEVKYKMARRKRECLYELERSTSESLISGNHVDPIINGSWFEIDLSNDILDEALGDLEQRLCLDDSFRDHFNVDLMKEALKVKSIEIDVEYFGRMRSFSKIVTLMNAISSRRPVPNEYKRSMRTPNCIVLQGKKKLVHITSMLVGISSAFDSGEYDGMRIYDGDWIRCGSDVATERFLLNMTSLYGNYMAKDHYPPWGVISKLCRWGDKVLERFGNSGYKLIKAYEALVTGYILCQGTDTVVDKDLFYNNTKQDLLIENIEWAHHLKSLHEIFSSCVSIHWMSQIYGLHRIWGHPTVDQLKGMEKVITIGRKDIVLSGRAAAEISRHFKYMFVKSYRAENKRYPNIHTVNQEIIEIVRNNSPEMCEDWAANSPIWDCLEFGPVFQIPETFNLSMIVADKSVSPTKSELRRNINARGSVMNPDLRRGVLRWLNDDTVCPKEFLTTVDQGRFPEDHKIIGLTPKERELNPVPRMFALMSHYMRVYVVMTESMLSEHILPLFPQITMTDSLLDLSKKMYENVKEQRTNDGKSKIRGKKTVCFSLDFEKWNGHMRKESTFGVFESLGRLFGMPNLYNATYDIFAGSYIYLADGSYTPTVESTNLIVEEPYSFIGHRGGLEGLRQKGWSLFTIVALDYICSKHNVIYKNMGMGDNQILMVTAFSYKVSTDGQLTREGEKEIKRKLDNLFIDLMDVFGELGLPLKPLETWKSESLFLYGKFPLWKGTPLTMDLKRLMRTFPFSNDDIMTTENILNTIAGSATSANQFAPSVSCSYMIGVFMLSVASDDLLNYHPLTGRGLLEALTSPTAPRRGKGKNSDIGWGVKTKTMGYMKTPLGDHRMSKHTMRLLLQLIPRSLGGYVSFNLPTLMMRGFPDNASRDMYVLKAMHDRNKEVSPIDYAFRWTKPILMPEINYKLLMEDIMSLNLFCPVTPMASVRQSVERYMSDPSVIKNSEFRDLMSIKNDQTEQVLAEQLCMGQTLHIRLIHDIYESTIIGYVDSIVSKVTKTSSIQRIAMTKSGTDVSIRLKDDEENYFKFFTWRCSVEGEEWISECPTTQVKRIREMGWRKTLKGITIAFPLSFMEKTSCHKNGVSSCSCLNGFVSSFFSDSEGDLKRWNQSIGGGLPYLGSMTREKVTVQTGSKIYSSEPLVKRPVKLLRAINWFVPSESETADVIRSCLESVTDVDPNQFTGVSEGTSGAESHRYRDSSLSHGTLSMSNYLYSTRSQISTDSWTRYSKGGLNYDIHFQALLCMITESNNQLVSKCICLNEMLPRVEHWVQSCEECINLVDEGFTDIYSKDAKSFIPSSKTNKYLYVAGANVSYIEDIRPYQRMISECLREEDYLNMSPHEKLNWLIDSMTDGIVSSMIARDDELFETAVAMHSGNLFNRLTYLKVSGKSLVDSTMAKIRVIAEFRCIQKNKSMTPSRYDIVSMARSLIMSAPVGCYIGLALIFSWAESRDATFYPEMFTPDTIPPTLSSACLAIQKSLFSLASFDRLFPGRRSTNIVEELKDKGLVYKLIAIHKAENKEGICEHCLTALKSTHYHEFTKQNIEIVCELGHNLYERMDLRSNLARVTMDRLRKDSSSNITVNEIRKRKQWRPLTTTTVVSVFNSSIVRHKFDELPVTEFKKWFGSGETLPQDLSSSVKSSRLMNILSLPTSSKYKYVEIFSHCHMSLRKIKKCIVFGDGLGGTSEVLSKMFQMEITVSTMLNSETVIPQIMPGLFEEESKRGEVLVNKTEMVNKCNNILSERWHSDWMRAAAESECLISDIEIMGVNRSEDRKESFRKLLELGSWSLFIIKDYLHDRSELASRMASILKATSKFKLVTCSNRQSGSPECWWIGEQSSVSRCKYDECKNTSVFKPNIVRDTWTALHRALTKSHDSEVFVNICINELVVNRRALTKMECRLYYWSYLPIIGTMLPDEGGFTKVLGRLQKGMKPESVSFSRSSGATRLYRSDQIKLREIMLTMAISMIGCIERRREFLNESKTWHLGWSGKENTSTWMPYLYKNLNESCELGLSPDYLGVCSMHMKKMGLVFLYYRDTILFDYSRERRYLCFPVAKNSVIRLKRIVNKENDRSVGERKPTAGRNIILAEDTTVKWTM